MGEGRRRRGGRRLPSGRVHAIGGGNLILEIQQNSDTTYRVYDWGRLDDKGNPRDLHIEESLRCINFHDFEPQFAQPHGEKIVECPHFRVERSFFDEGEARDLEVDPSSFQYLFVAEGKFSFEGKEWSFGDSAFIPANSSSFEITGLAPLNILVSVMFGSR